VAVGHGVVVIDLDEDVDEFAWFAHILILYFQIAGHITGTDI